jgi:hypothetical protein
MRFQEEVDHRRRGKLAGDESRYAGQSDTVAEVHGGRPLDGQRLLPKREPTNGGDEKRMKLLKLFGKTLFAGSLVAGIAFFMVRRIVADRHERSRLPALTFLAPQMEFTLLDGDRVLRGDLAGAPLFSEGREGTAQYVMQGTASNLSALLLGYRYKYDGTDIDGNSKTMQEFS